MDFLWGFSLFEIDPKTQEILQLVTRRGILRPKVLFFGPEQGPGIFQSFVDSAFGALRGKEGEDFCSFFN